MNGGGAQRVISQMANSWVEKNHNIFILTISKEKPFYDLNEKLNIIQLNMTGKPNNPISGFYANLLRIKTVRKTIKSLSPDIVISFLTQTNIISTLACKSLNIPIIISERINPEKASISAIWKVARYIIYRLSNIIVVQTKFAQEFFKGYKTRTEIIINPVKKIDLSRDIKEPIILAAGRLTYQKGFDLLIKAFAGVSSKEWQLIILGDGPERNNLHKLITDLDLINRVQMPGLVKNIDTFFSRASIFVLSSRFEGFPNILCEAMAAGLPCISFNCNSGPLDIIDQKVNGILVENENEEELSLAINTLINNEHQRETMGKEALKIAAKMNLGKVMHQWENIIFSILNK